MRSLTLKLTLAFLAVGLTGALLLAFFVEQRAERAVNQFATESREALIAELQTFYQTTGSWNGVAQTFPPSPPTPPSRDGRSRPRVAPPVLVGADGRVVVGNEHVAEGTQIAPSVRASGQPITVNDTVVGWLLVEAGSGPPGRGAPEADLLRRITEAITYGAIGATALALLLGIVLARTLTQPIRELTAATQAVAKGALGQQVAVRSRDELGTLATSFNQMSADLAHASTVRRQMTADIAHDLRTPLSVILGYTEALRDGMLPPDQDTFDTMHTEAQHLQRLIDDLRTLSLADAGELRLLRQPIAPHALLERAAAAHRAQAGERGIALAMDVRFDLPAVDVDEERMAQVLGNLISNALRYTSAGGTVTLAAQRCGDGVCLRVQDTGSGIAPADLPHVFDRFYRADAAREQTGSSGLGLAIAKGIVEAHGGRITVDSSVGHGTTFTITLPAAATIPDMHELIDA